MGAKQKEGKRINRGLNLSNKQATRENVTDHVIFTAKRKFEANAIKKTSGGKFEGQKHFMK